MTEKIFPTIWKKRIAVIFISVLAVTLIYLLHNILMPFLCAWLAAYLVSPLVDLMERRLKFTRAQDVVLVMAFSMLFLFITLAVTLPIFIDETISLASSLPLYRDRIVATFHNWQASGKIHPAVLHVADQIFEKIQASAPTIAAEAGQWFLSWLNSLLGILLFLMNLILFFFVFFYFLRDFKHINRLMIEAVPVEWRAPMKKLLVEIDLNLRAVLRGQFIVAIAMGILYSIGLSIVGVPYSVLIGTVAGLGNFLPYVGPMLGMIPALLAIALSDGGNGFLNHAIGVLIVFGIVQFIESFFLTPRIAGGSMGLGPVAVIFAVSACGALFGFIGVVMALPLAAIMRVLIAHAWEQYTHSDFYKAA